MSDHSFLIPKQTDQSLILALVAIRSGFNEAFQTKLHIKVYPHHGGDLVNFGENDPISSGAIDYILTEQTQMMPNLYLHDPRLGQDIFRIERNHKELCDRVTVLPDWIQRLDSSVRSISAVKLISLARKHLRAADTEAALSHSSDSEWSRYRDAQQAILGSLEETLKAVTVDFGRKVVAAETAASEKAAQREEQRQAEYKTALDKLQVEHEKALKLLEERETALKAREESFNTKEARYVTRKQLETQISEIKGWIDVWHLTKGTAQKRHIVTGGYVAAILVFGALVFWFGHQSVEILRSNDISKVPWWQWGLLSLKSILPLAAFTTFVIYFIRWSSAWARQHADEEFRNRARILDVGRSLWLLEAVRDAQDHDKEIPAELLRDLSKNLFSNSVSGETSDLHPQAVSDFLMQGLSSLRVKTPDGREVEAMRSKK